VSILTFKIHKNNECHLLRPGFTKCEKDSPIFSEEIKKSHILKFLFYIYATVLFMTLYKVHAIINNNIYMLGL
jgi:hypothetical protein